MNDCGETTSVRRVQRGSREQSEDELRPGRVAGDVDKKRIGRAAHKNLVLVLRPSHRAFEAGLDGEKRLHLITDSTNVRKAAGLALPERMHLSTNRAA